MTSVVDCDQHLFETPDLWTRYADPGLRDRALRLEPDDLGYWWVVHQDRKLGPALRQVPGDTTAVGEHLQRLRRGEPAEFSYDEMTPPEYYDPDARLEVLDAQGVDRAVVFPNYGLGFEGPLAGDIDSLHANTGAWNRWAREVTATARGRLLPVGHLTLDDPQWVESQLAALSTGGVRAAMVAPALVGGRRLSHPDLRATWAAFVEHGVTPVFHVGSFPTPFDPAWYEGDPDRANPVMSSVFLHAPAALALADLAVHGVLADLPELRIGVMELSALWVPLFLLMLDGGFDFHARFNGEPLTRMELRPSEYVRRQVRVAAFSYESPDRLEAKVGDMFMACSDYPHSEGTATPLADYERSCRRGGTPAAAPGLFGGNATWLLGN